MGHIETIKTLREMQIKTSVRKFPHGPGLVEIPCSQGKGSLAKGWQTEATPRPVSFTCRVKGGKGREKKNRLSAFNYKKKVYV